MLSTQKRQAPQFCNDQLQSHPSKVIQNDGDLPTDNGTDEETRVEASSLFGKAYNKFDEKMIKGFVPGYFVNVMGTGITSGILYRFAYEAKWLQIVGLIFWGIGIFFFIVNCICMIISCLKYKENIGKFHYDVGVAPFMGCIPMGYNALCNTLYYIVGKDWIIGIFVLWWISVFLCLFTSIIVFYFTYMARFSYSKEKPISLESLNGTILLPIVALTVTSSSGQLFALDLPTLNLQLLTMIVCMVLWFNAIALSFICLTIIIHRYISHKVPNTGGVFTTFIPIGFLGQGGFSILLFGNNVYQLLIESKDIDPTAYFSSTFDISDATFRVLVAHSVFFISVFMGLFLVSFGYFNTIIAIMSTLSKIMTKNPNPNFCSCQFKCFSVIKFNRAFWAMSFPLGTMALSNTQLHKVLTGLSAFKVIGAMYGVTTALITTGCCLGFLYHVYKDIRGLYH